MNIVLVANYSSFFKRHYSYNDSTEIKKKITGDNINVQIKNFKEIQNTEKDNKYDYHSIGLDPFKNIMIFMADFLNDLCDRPTTVYRIKGKIEELKKYYTIIPRPLVMLSIGTKEYTRDFRDMMLPGTLFFPDDIDEIRKLEDGEYIIKSGFSGSSVGNIILKKDDLLKHLNEAYSNLGKYKPDEECKSPFRIIQKKSDLFEKCLEIRFFVIGGIMRGFAILDHNFRLGSINYFATHYDLIDKIDGKKINQNIYNFVKKVANKCNELWDDNFFYRIDIITDCDSFDSFFDPNWNKSIYMNEIENLGSGLKSDAMIVNDNGNYAIVTKNEDPNIYDFIVDEIKNRIAKL